MKFDKLVNLYLENIAGSPKNDHNVNMKNELIDRVIEMVGDLVNDGAINSAEDVNHYLGGSEKFKEIIGRGVEAEMNDDSEGDNIESIWSVVSSELEKLSPEDFKGWDSKI
jgi:hypothetical protein